MITLPRSACFNQWKLALYNEIKWLPYIWNFWRWEILAKMTLGRCVKFSLFSLFQGLSMKTYCRVYFSLCLFLAISGRSRTQRNLNQCEKFPIYSVKIAYLVQCTAMATIHMMSTNATAPDTPAIMATEKYNIWLSRTCINCPNLEFKIVLIQRTKKGFKLMRRYQHD